MMVDPQDRCTNFTELKRLRDACMTVANDLAVTTQGPYMVRGIDRAVARLEEIANNTVLEWYEDRAELEDRADCAEDRLEAARRSYDAALAGLNVILEALSLGTHARPYSAHEVVRREVIPAIDRLRRGQWQ